jgi:dedicator of cytokinesis protein 9/10/11
MINLNNHSVDLKESKFDSIFTLDGQSILNDNYEENLFKALNGCFSKLSSCVFRIQEPHDRIYLVARIEKILDGKSYSSSLVPYLKANKKNAKTAIKLNRKMKLICSKLGAYRMPFAWAVKPVFNKIGDIDSSEFIIYQQDINHLNDDELFKYLADFGTKEKHLNKLTQIDGKLKFKLDEIQQNESLSIISDSYQLKNELKRPIDAYECETFDLNVSKIDKNTEFEQKIKQISIYNEFKNHLYIYPKSLKYDTQKEFSKVGKN